MSECQHGHRPYQDDPECFQCRDQSYKEEIAKLRAEVKELILERNDAWKQKKANLERARSAELQNSELISMLRQIEWVTDGYSGVKICPCCEQDKRHNPGCKLDELIHKMVIR